MVDFNNEMTITTPAYDILKVLILQRRDGFIESLEAYNRTKSKGVIASTYEVRSRLISLFEEIRSSFLSSETDKEVMEIEAKIKNDDIDSIMEVYHIIDEWLYKKKLTQFDTGKNLGGDVVKRNQARGWR